MVLGLDDGFFLLASFVVPLLLVVFVMPPYLRFLLRKGKVVDDVHKPALTKVPSPAGPLLLAGIIAGEMVAYFFFRTLIPLAIIGSVGIAFLVGIADDLHPFGGKTKPFLLLFAAVPLVLAQELQPGVYSARIFFPILGPSSEHFFIFTVLVVASFPIVSNAFNMMDAFNGEMSGFATMTSLAIVFGTLLVPLVLRNYSLVHLATALPLVAVSLGFYLFNRYPSRAFDGNSGSLALGAMFVTLAVTNGVEIAAIVAIIPAILNSFYILSSVRGFVERRKMGGRPTYMGKDGRLYASNDPSAPTTLVRMVLLEGPLTERELVRRILTLTAIACLLSAATSLLTWAR